MVYNAKSVYNAKGVYNGETVYNEGGGDPSNTVIVGGIEYTFVQVGNFYIITENLRNHISRFEYPNKNPANESSMGLLYNAYYMFNEIIPILPIGWRVPTIYDWSYLRDNVSLNSNDYISTDDGGNNLLQTNFRLCGYINSSDIVTGFGNKILLWSSSEFDSSRTKNIDVTKNAMFDITDFSNGSSTSNANTSLSVRIIKDV